MPITISPARPFAPARLDEFIHGGDEALAAFERKTLLAHVLGVQETFRPFGGRQALQDALLLFAPKVRLCCGWIRASAATSASDSGGGIHVFGTDGANVVSRNAFPVNSRKVIDSLPKKVLLVLNTVSWSASLKP